MILCLPKPVVLFVSMTRLWSFNLYVFLYHFVFAHCVQIIWLGIICTVLNWIEDSKASPSFVAVVLLIMLLTCFFYSPYPEPVNPVTRAEQRGLHFRWTHSPVCLFAKPIDWLTIWLTSEDLHPYGANKVQPAVFSEPDVAQKGSLAHSQEREDVMEEGRGWY